MPYIPKKIPFERMHRLIRGYASAPVLADKLLCSPPTARKKIENPEFLTLGDLKRISQGLHIPIEDIRQAITW